MRREAFTIVNGSVVLPAKIVRADIAVDRGSIAAIGTGASFRRSLPVDAAGCYVAPGFIDTHIHGNPAAILAHEVRYGTTGVVVAESCAPLETIIDQCERIRQFIAGDPLGRAVLGLRLEGPYINPEKAGAQDRRYIRRPDGAELAALIVKTRRLLKMMTIAPECPGAPALIRTLVTRGVIASIGHSNATSTEAKEGFARGIRHATHLYNAMRKPARTDPGVVGAVLSDRRVAAEVIADFVHIPRRICRRLIRAKGIDRTVLVTDSVRALRQPGVRKREGAYRFADGRLAGSALTMIGAVRNAVRGCGCTVPEAVRMAALNPARLLGCERVKGSIATGKDADIVIFDEDFDVKMAVVRGRIAYRKRGF